MAKAKKKVAKKTVKKQPVATSEQLALQLGQKYAQLMQCQQNIQAINKELERRQLLNISKKG